jgi:hypothetical protein
MMLKAVAKNPRVTMQLHWCACKSGCPSKVVGLIYILSIAKRHSLFGVQIKSTSTADERFLHWAHTAQSRHQLLTVTATILINSIEKLSN